MNLRAVAARVICQVVKGASLSDTLPDMSAQFHDIRDKAFLQAVCYGVCREYFRLDAILQWLLDKPLKKKDDDIHALLLVGLYQLKEMRVPAHAAVAETVSAAGSKKNWAKGFVNAVLRNYQRRAQERELNNFLQQKPAALYAHPAWMIDKVSRDWPDDWQAVLTANNQLPPLVLRVNLKKISRAQYLEKLSIKAAIVPETETGIVLEEAVDVAQLPNFFAGEVSVQDGAAQLAAGLLQLAKGQRVLDACAAPGGKTTHILELQPDIAELVAVDRDSSRLHLVQENLERLNLSATCVCADAGAVKSWWDGKLFDRILLDAPCSASGVIRRHPDIRLLRRATDISVLAAEQLRLLTALWQLLKPDGLMVYATCSIFAEENTHVLQSFLETHADAEEKKIDSAWGKVCSIGKQILPGMHGMDGFYFACLRKC